VNGAKPTEETTGMPQILRAFGFTGEVTVKMAGQTHGQAHKDLGMVIGLAATWAFMQIPRTPEGAAKEGHVNAALVVAVRSFGSLITAALSMNPDTRALAAEGGDAAWQDLKDGIAAVSRAMDEAFGEK
jgi:hypothetical protein